MSKGRRGTTGPTILIVLDGWGHRPETEANAIALARTPTWDRLVSKNPMTLLEASGPAVGLPENQMGNSEVGHLNLGAGRVIKQDIVRISDTMDSGEFLQIPALTSLCDGVRKRDATLHFLGLIGIGGVHAVHRHLEGALELAVQCRVPRVAIHGFLDGRDTPPSSAAGYLGMVKESVAQANANGVECRVATATGRYYAMDRDRRWERTRLAYDAMLHGAGRAVEDPVEGVLAAYDRGETDEFIKPLVCQRDGRPSAVIRDGDGIFCLNFRADRMRQIVRALAAEGFDGFETGPRPAVDLVTMTQYDETLPFANAFAPITVTRFVAQVLSEAGLTQFRTAETEKYAHVTYFFNCGIEAPFAGEQRLLVDSPRVATYDLQPQMSARGVTEVLCKAIEDRVHDFILCNYANGDMVGHTGVLPAAIQAVETVDSCLDRVLRSAERVGAVTMITADHGNCELMVDPATGGPHTAHTTNLVPYVVTGDDRIRSLRAGGRLCDVGPTILNLLGMEVPHEMTGRDLREGAA